MVGSLIGDMPMITSTVVTLMGDDLWVWFLVFPFRSITIQQSQPSYALQNNAVIKMPWTGLDGTAI